jgi:hypothetical protein
MRKSLLICILLSSIAVFQSCSSNTGNVEAIHYFDIPSFFKSEVIRLEKTNAQVLKTVETNGESEQKNIRPKSWKDELSVFSSIDLNKSSFIGKYKVDSSLSAEVLHVSYVAIDNRLPIKSCSFSFIGNKLHSIQANKFDPSLVLTSEIKWRYVPDSGYSVIGSQQVKGFDPTNYSVSAIFAN